jgi:hypothetical protein
VASSAFDSESRPLEGVSGARLERTGASSLPELCGVDCRALIGDAPAIVVDDESMAIDAIVDGANVRADASLAGIRVSRALGVGGSLGVGLRARTICGSWKLSGPASAKLSGPESRRLSGLDSRTPSDRGCSRSCRPSNSDRFDTRGDSL